MELHRLNSRHLPDIRSLLLNYPYKKYQQKFQGLDQAGLADFLVKGVERDCIPAGNSSSLRNEGPYSVVVTDSGKVVALASCHHCPWHGKVYGLKMAKIQPFLSYISPRDYTTFLLMKMLSFADNQEIEHLSCRFDANEWENIHQLERQGFYIVDCSLKLSRRFDKELPQVKQQTDVEDMQLIDYNSSYDGAIMDIAARSHQYNHFFADDNLDRKRTGQLFSHWVKRCAAGLAKYVWLAQYRDNVIGFVTLIEPTGFNRALETNLIVLDFIVIKPEYQGSGLGSAFLWLTLKQLAEHYRMVELRTSHNNYSALALYQRFGFRIISADIILHTFLKNRRRKNRLTPKAELV